MCVPSNLHYISLFMNDIPRSSCEGNVIQDFSYFLPGKGSVNTVGSRCPKLLSLLCQWMFKSHCPHFLSLSLCSISMSSPPLIFSAPFSYLRLTRLHRGWMDDIHILAAEMNYSPCHLTLRVTFLSGSLTHDICLPLDSQRWAAYKFTHRH